MSEKKFSGMGLLAKAMIGVGAIGLCKLVDVMAKKNESAEEETADGTVMDAEFEVVQDEVSDVEEV